jgi:hypothetical protein
MKQQARRNADYINSLPGSNAKRNWIYRFNQFCYKAQLQLRYFFYRCRRY